MKIWMKIYNNKEYIDEICKYYYPKVNEKNC